MRTDNDNPTHSKTAKIQKADLIVTLSKVLSDKNIKIPRSNQHLIRQLSIYKENDKNIPTDRVMSLALATWLAEDKSKVKAPVFQTVQW